LNKTLKIWNDDISVTSADAFLIYKKDFDFFQDLIDNDEIAKPKMAFVISNDISLSEMSIFKYIEYKYTFILSSSDIFKSVFFEFWEGLAIGNAIKGDYAVDDKPTILFKYEYLIDILLKTFLFRKNILSTSPMLGLKSSDFDHNWVNKRPCIINDIEDFQKNIKSGVLKNKVISNIYNYLDILKTSITDVFNSDLSLCLLYASAFCYSSGIYLQRQGDTDKSLLLLHRCLDFFIQSIGVEDQIVRLSDKGLIYDSLVECNKDVNLMTTKGFLHSITISEKQDKVFKKVNFLRNRSVLTHSFYTISRNDLTENYTDVHKMLKNIEGNNKWSNKVKSFLNKPEVNNIDIFDFEDSFDLYVKAIEY